MTAAATKPTTIPVVVEQIPAELRALDRWVVWRWELREDKRGELKWTKPPHQPNGRYARSDTPSTWSTFADALRAFQAGGFDGIGVTMTADDDLVGVDLDHCVTDGAVDPWALGIARAINSYTEISPSGTGLRIIVHAKLPASGRKRGDVECYERGRYLTITGHKLAPAPTTIEHRQEQIDAFHAEHFPAPEQTSKATTNGSAGHLTDSQVLDLIRGSKQAAKFEALYRGDDTLHNGDTSVGDLALVAQLAFYSQDEAQLDRLFQGSGRARDKWTEKHSSNGSTYGQLTIKRALSKLDETYTPPADGPTLVDAPGTDGPKGGAAGPAIRLLTIDELDQLKPPAWRIERILPDASFATVFGVQSTYKSFVALDWTLSIGAGIPWLGHETSPGIAVYVAAEGGTGLSKRIKAWKATRDHDPAKLAANFRAIPRIVNLRDPATVKELHQVLVDQLDAAPNLLVIDTWSRSMPGGNENAAEEVSAAVDRLDRIRDDLDCGMLIVHHAGLETGRERGSSSLPYAMDCRWETDGKPNADTITLRNHKQKDWETTPPIRLRRHVVGEGDEASLILRLDSDPCSRHHPVVGALNRAGALSQNQVVMLLTGTKATCIKDAQDTAACGRCPVETWTEGRKVMYRRTDQTTDEHLKV